MSDYHVLSQTRDKKMITVIFRIPIPNTNNAAGKSYRIALKEKLEHNLESGTIESCSPCTTPAELTEVQNGEIYELPRSKRFSRLGLTNAQKRDELDAEFNMLQTEARNELQTELEWWGYKKDVV